MYNVNRWLFLILFTITCLSTSAFNTPMVPADASSSQSQHVYSKFTLTIQNNTLNDVHYEHQRILFIGESTVQDSLTFINCSIYFSTSNTSLRSSGLVLMNNANLTIINSSVSYINPSDQFQIIGLQQNNLTVYNSVISSNSGSNLTTFLFYKPNTIFANKSTFSNSSNLFSVQNAQHFILENSQFNNTSKSAISVMHAVECNFTNNTFVFDPHFYNNSLQFNTISNLILNNNTFLVKTTSSYSALYNATPIVMENILNIIIQKNNFTHFTTILFFNNCSNIKIDNNFLTDFTNGFVFDHNITNVSIYKNNFIKGNYSLIINDYTNYFNLNCTFNNFYTNNNSILLIKNFDVSGPLTGNNLSENFYASFHNIDFNNDGFYDNPFINTYFIDTHPLSYPFEDYYIVSNQLAVQYNYRENELLSAGNNFQLFGFKWSLLIMFYSIVILLPIILLLIANKKKLKAS